MRGPSTTFAPVSVDRPLAEPTAMQNVMTTTAAARSRFRFIPLPPSLVSQADRRPVQPTSLVGFRPAVNRDRGDDLPEAEAPVLIGVAGGYEARVLVARERGHADVRGRAQGGRAAARDQHAVVVEPRRVVVGRHAGR